VTAEQIAYVAQLQRAGDEAAALQAANDAATSGFNEQTKSLRDNMGTIESSADSLKRAFKSMWDAALDIGRPDTAQEMVAKAKPLSKKRMKSGTCVKVIVMSMMRRAPGSGMTETARAGAGYGAAAGGLPRRTKKCIARSGCGI
jgi:hypothetical protein